MARDWSAEGAWERAQSYGRICAELDRLFPDRWGICVNFAGEMISLAAECYLAYAA